MLAEHRKAYDKLDEDDKEFFDAEKLVEPLRRHAHLRRRPRGRDPRPASSASTWRSARCCSPTGCARRASRSTSSSRTTPRVPATRTSTRSCTCRPTSGPQQGVSIAAGDSLIAPRAEEIRRRIAPVNHYRAIDAAELLGLRVAVVPHAGGQLGAGVRAGGSRRGRARDARRRRQVASRASRSTPTRARKGYGPLLDQRDPARRGRVGSSST